MKDVYGIIYGFQNSSGEYCTEFEDDIYEDYKEALETAINSNLSYNSKKVFEDIRKYFEDYRKFSDEEIAKAIATDFIDSPEPVVGFCAVKRFIFKPKQKERE